MRGRCGSCEKPRSSDAVGPRLGGQGPLDRRHHPPHHRRRPLGARRPRPRPAAAARPGVEDRCPRGRRERSSPCSSSTKRCPSPPRRSPARRPSAAPAAAPRGSPRRGAGTPRSGCGRPAGRSARRRRRRWRSCRAPRRRPAPPPALRPELPARRGRRRPPAGSGRARTAPGGRDRCRGSRPAPPARSLPSVERRPARRGAAASACSSGVSGCARGADVAQPVEHQQHDLAFTLGQRLGQAGEQLEVAHGRRPCPMRCGKVRPRSRRWRGSAGGRAARSRCRPGRRRVEEPRIGQHDPAVEALAAGVGRHHRLDLGDLRPVVLLGVEGGAQLDVGAVEVDGALPGGMPDREDEAHLVVGAGGEERLAGHQQRIAEGARRCRWRRSRASGRRRPGGRGGRSSSWSLLAGLAATRQGPERRAEPEGARDVLARPPPARAAPGEQRRSRCRRRPRRPAGRPGCRRRRSRRRPASGCRRAAAADGRQVGRPADRRQRVDLDQVGAQLGAPPRSRSGSGRP